MRLKTREHAAAFVLAAAIGIPAFALFYCAPLCDPDVGWHLAFGEYIVRHQTIPTQDVLRFTPQESPLHLHGWLSQVAFYALERSGGLRFLRLCTAIVMLATLALLSRLFHTVTGNVHLTAVGVLVAVLTSVHLFHPRARIFTWPLFLLAFELLGLDDAPLSARRLLGLFLLTVVWMNLHAEAAVLPFFIVVLLLDTGLTRPWPRRRLASLGLAAALTFGALFVSPLGASWLPDAMQNYRVNRDNSWEWFNLFAYQGVLDHVFADVPSDYSPMYVHLLGYPFSLFVTMAVAAAYLASLALRPKGSDRVPGVLVNLWALFLAFNMQRNSWLLFIPIASALRTFSLRLGLGARSRAPGSRRRWQWTLPDNSRFAGTTPFETPAEKTRAPQGERRIRFEKEIRNPFDGAQDRRLEGRAPEQSNIWRAKPWQGLAATAGVLLMTVLTFRPVVRPATWLTYDDRGWDARMFPTKAAAFLQAAKLGGNAFTQAEWGGYLVHQRPDLLVFMHGHWAEAPKTYADYQAIFQEGAGFDDLLDRYGATLLVVPPAWGADLPPAKWIEVFGNVQSRIYVRSNDAASLAAAEAYYRNLGIPFSRAAGFDPEQALVAAPAWAREFWLQAP